MTFKSNYIIRRYSHPRITVVLTISEFLYFQASSFSGHAKVFPGRFGVHLDPELYRFIFGLIEIVAGKFSLTINLLVLIFYISIHFLTHSLLFKVIFLRRWTTIIQGDISAVLNIHLLMMKPTIHNKFSA